MISNQEILNRFDVLYNNIMSNQAPGLDAYEVSVFWNKAQVEVLKNHLTPGGNKYTTGFDQSSKRQVEFSSLIKEDILDEFTLEEVPSHNSNLWIPTIGDSDVNPFTQKTLAITNERVQTFDKKDYIAVMDYIASFTIVISGEGDPEITTVSMFIERLLKLGIKQGHPLYDKAVSISDEMQLILADWPDDNNAQERWEALRNQIAVSLTLSQAIAYLNMASLVHNRVVVPINNIEYDTLMSRPFGYPPKSQAWRIVVETTPEIVVGPNEVPLYYYIRYIKLPKDVNLEDATDVPEIPEVLVDEVLQRAVELAKNSWEGNIETTKALGERSE